MKTKFGPIFILFAFVSIFQIASGQDLIYLHDGNVIRAKIIEVNEANNRVSFLQWENQTGPLVNVDASQVQRIKYQYGAEKILNATVEPGYSETDPEQRVTAQIQQVNHPTLVFSGEEEMALRSFEWTKEELEFVHLQNKNRRFGVDLSNMKRLVMPGEIQLVFSMGVNSDETESQSGTVLLRNGYNYPATDIVITEGGVTFNELYSHIPFRWNMDEVDYVVWENQMGGVDVQNLDELTDPLYENPLALSRSNFPEGTSTDLSELDNSFGQKKAQEENPALVTMSGKPQDWPDLSWPLTEPSTLVSYRLLPSRFNKEWSLFSERNVSHNLLEASEVLQEGFEREGYDEIQFFELEEGFVMMTPVEKMKSDGSRQSLDQRWSTEAIRFEEVGFDKAVKQIKFRDPGFYRMIMCIVSPDNIQFPRQQEDLVANEGPTLNGLEFLPDYYKNKIVQGGYYVYFMVYEWEQRDMKTAAKYRKRGSSILPADMHLEKSGIKAALN